MPNVGGTIAQPREFLIWIGIATIILLGILNAVIKGRFIESPFKIFILSFAVLILSSSIFNPVRNMDVFIMHSMKLMAGILLWFALLQFDLTDRERLSILLLVFISVAIESVIGVMQFFGLYRYIPITPAPETGMVGGAFQQRNLFASWVAIGLAISFYFIFTERFTRYRGKMKSAFFACVALLSLSLIISGSRTGIIGAGLAVMVILASRAGHYASARRYLTLWLVIFSVGIAGGYTLLGVQEKLGIEKPTVKQIKWFSDIQHPNIQSRILMCKTSFEMFKEKPVFGQGFANFGSLYMYYQAKTAKSKPEYKELISNYTNHPHNEVFKVMAESGIAGIAAILIVAAGFITTLLRSKREEAGLYVAILTPLLIHMMFEYPLELSTGHYLVFLLFLSMATSHSVKETKLHIKKSAIVAILSCSVLLYISATGYMARTFYDYMNMVIYHRDYGEGKKPSVKNIEGAVDNIYLRNWAKPTYMFVTAEDAVRDAGKNRDFLNDFLKWSNSEKQRQPITEVFYYDASVLLSMGIHYKRHAYFDDAMNTVEEGLYLYPNNKDLKALRPRIFSEAVKAIFQQLHGK